VAVWNVSRSVAIERIVPTPNGKIRVRTLEANLALGISHKEPVLISDLFCDVNSMADRFCTVSMDMAESAAPGIEESCPNIQRANSCSSVSDQHSLHQVFASLPASPVYRQRDAGTNFAVAAQHRFLPTAGATFAGSYRAGSLSRISRRATRPLE